MDICRKQLCLKKYQSFEAHKGQQLLYYFHTELFEACIVYKQLPLNFVVDLSETVRFWRI